MTMNAETFQTRVACKARRIYDILVKFAGAPDIQSTRAQFESFFVDAHENKKGGEFRFQGTLGFGGKFFIDSEKMWVACYKEDATLRRSRIIRKINEKLVKIPQ